MLQARISIVIHYTLRAYDTMEYKKNWGPIFLKSHNVKWSWICEPSQVYTAYEHSWMK